MSTTLNTCARLAIPPRTRNTVWKLPVKSKRNPGIIVKEMNKKEKKTLIVSRKRNHGKNYIRIQLCLFQNNITNSLSKFLPNISLPPQIGSNYTLHIIFISNCSKLLQNLRRSIYHNKANYCIIKTILQSKGSGDGR